MKHELSESSLLGAIEEAKSIAEELKDELENWRDNLPESLQYGSKADELTEAIDYFDDAISSFEEAEEALSDIEELGDRTYMYSQPRYPRSTYMSREKRMNVGIAALSGYTTEIGEGFDDELTSSVFEAIDRGLDSLNNICFPRMR